MIGLALLILVAGISCFGGCLMMLSEGPHGPHGEIGWAPGQGQDIFRFFAVSAVAVAAAIVLLVTVIRKAK